jgi:hypothetical protein
MEDSLMSALPDEYQNSDITSLSGGDEINGITSRACKGGGCGPGCSTGSNND